MFYEYAIEPAVLSSWERVRYFLGAVGPWNGRFIADYPHRWKKAVYKALDCPDIERSRIVERLQRLDPRVIAKRPGGSYDVNKTWLDNVDAEHARQAFHAIVATKTDGRPHILDAATVSDDEPLWEAHAGKMLQRDPLVFSAALNLLLTLSSQVVLIDPYFRAHKPNKTAPLVAFCSSLVGSATTIEVHFATECDDATRDPEERTRQHRRFGSWCMSESARVLPRALAEGTTVRLHAWRERAGGARLHNRFLITDVGGVQFGDGIEQGEPGHQDRVSILDEPSRVLLWNQYLGSPPAFEAVGEPKEIIGARRRRQ